MVTPSAALLAALVLAASTLGAPPASAQTPPPVVAPLAQAPVARLDTLPLPVPTSRFRKPSMMVSGVVVTAVGLALLVGGSILAAQSRASQNACLLTSDECYDDFIEAAGILTATFGALHVVVGVPLLAVGALPPPAPAPPASVPGPAPAAGARSLGLAWSF